MAINPGELRTLISLQRSDDPVIGQCGDVELSFKEYAKEWAKVEYTAGREMVNASQVVAEATHDILIRYRDDVHPTHRVVLDSRVLEIVSCGDASGRRELMTLHCKELR